jgi:hypothetical protein
MQKKPACRRFCPTRQRSDFHPAQILRELVDAYREAGGPRYGQLTVCSAKDEPCSPPALAPGGFVIEVAH